MDFIGSKTRAHVAVLYDITSSYMEGAYKGSSLVAFGHDRDGRKGHEQIVIGLVCSSEGCPVAVEVFPGNTKDETTVVDKVAELQQRFGLSELVFVGDRGMVTRSESAELRGRAGVSTISALTHREMVELLRREVIQLELFDQRGLPFVADPETPARRYVLCRNPQTRAHETRKRRELMEATAKESTAAGASTTYSRNSMPSGANASTSRASNLNRRAPRTPTSKESSIYWESRCSHFPETPNAT